MLHRDLDAADSLRTRLKSYLRDHGHTLRRGRDGRMHQVTSHSAHLRRLIEMRFGHDSSMSQQAISNFLAGRSRAIGLDHARKLAVVIGLRTLPIRRIAR